MLVLNVCLSCYILQPLRIFNTWLGDPARLIVLESVLREIQRHRLLELVQQTGTVLLDGLKELEVSQVEEEERGMRSEP